MLDGSVMEILKWYLTLMLVLFSVGLIVFFFQLGDTNNYKQRVNYAIERQGGLTTEALEEVHQISDNEFGGRYRVERVKSEDDFAETKRVEYGEVVHYEIHADFDIMFIPRDVNMTFYGSSVSQIR